ncbi:MAG TPA: spore coat protein CotJB [Bacillota bacterium]|nr:spore coat protein CotJB [Bacillota bacterium]
MQREQLEMLKNLQAIEFTALELNLYLDTHPGDQRAMSEYSNIIREVEILKKAYTARYGPLMAEDNVNQIEWKWALEPWPWDLDY